MDWIKIIILTVTLLYASLLLLSILINLGTKQEQPGLEKYTSETRVSIIIPARNEEENILKCLESIAQQDFSKNNLQVPSIKNHLTPSTPPRKVTYPLPLPLKSPPPRYHLL